MSNLRSIMHISSPERFLNRGRQERTSIICQRGLPIAFDGRNPRNKQLTELNTTLGNRQPVDSLTISMLVGGDMQARLVQNVKRSRTAISIGHHGFESGNVSIGN